MCFDVPKIVRSPGCDHEHDEESRNGRDMKINILDDYIRTPEWFRGLSDVYRSTGGLQEPPGGLMGLMGLKWRRRGAAREGRAPPLHLVRIGQGGGRPPFLPLSLLLPLLILQLGKEGVLLPVGVGLLLVRLLLAGRTSPPCSFIYGGRGHPKDTTIDLLIS